MTREERDLLIEYRYNKMCRIENDMIQSHNALHYNIANHSLISCYLYHVVYSQCFRDVMADIWELLNMDYYY